MKPSRTCETCGNPVEYGGKGRPRRFCSEACYTEHRNRRRRVVPKFVYVVGDGWVENPDRRPKSKVR